ncbi:MAG TPA: MBOAT family O-acyltransferase [Bacteroidia bacterium]
MLFNSFEFALFLPIVFLLYWFVFNKRVRWQNLFLLFVSYVFYGWWDWRFLFLIAFSTTFDYFIGIQLGKIEGIRKRRILFGLSCLINIGFLGFFKYFNFFIDNLVAAFASMGYNIPIVPLQIILPVGISFYTFQSLSYTADVYLKKLKPTTDFILFATFISFFPQLVAGPIERAINMLPQFQNKRKFNFEEAKLGMQQILWGLFKKIVIADTLSVYVDQIFANYQSLPGSTLLLGAIYFSIQIYCDFSGYSSIAIGTAHLFGFSLMKNFSYPYFSKSVAEFWRNWHISLSTWFKDYVYIPLGGSRSTLQRTILNTLIVFALSGFWHGANWTFIIWGVLNGVYVIPSLLSSGKNKIAASPILDVIKIAFTFLLITLTWIFFRAQNVSQAFGYFKILFSKSLFVYPVQHGMALALPLIFILFIPEWLRKKNILLEQTLPIFLRWSGYLIMVIACLAFFKQNQSFIYFQF